LGDNFGISRAYIMVPVLIALGFIMVVLSPSKHLGVNKIKMNYRTRRLITILTLISLLALIVIGGG
jgi:hypothetical protein